MVTFNEMKQDKRLIHDEIKFTQQSTVLRTSSGWHYSEECKYLQDVVILLLGLCGPPNWRYVLIIIKDYFNWTIIFEWYAARCGCMNAHQKDTCFKKIRLHAQNLASIQELIINMMGGADDHLITPRVFTLTIWVKYSYELQNHKTNGCGCDLELATISYWLPDLQPMRSECGAQSDHLTPTYLTIGFKSSLAITLAHKCTCNANHTKQIPLQLRYVGVIWFGLH